MIDSITVCVFVVDEFKVNIALGAAAATFPNTATSYTYLKS